MKQILYELIYIDAKKDECIERIKERNIDDEQKIQLAKTFGCCRFVYNHFLDKCKNNGYIKAYDMCKKLKMIEIEYSFLKEVNDSKVNIVTVEDPVEFTMNGINQTQVNPKANMTFAAALRSILRQDPDIIMIGEIRDEETAEIAVRSAITGHIVFSTLHTNDAPGAVIRLEDMGVDDYLVADALVGVIAQRLVKRLCPACKKKGRTNAKEMEILGITEPITIARPQGCQFCNHTGYKGRIAVHEIMYMNEKMKNAVLTLKSLDELRALSIENGMTPLFNSCKSLVNIFLSICLGILSIKKFISKVAL